MPYTDAARNAMLDELGTLAIFAALFDADAGQNFTGEDSDDVVDLTSHGYSNGDLVVITALTGGSGLTTGFPYFVINAAANTFQLSRTVGGSAVSFGSNVTATSTIVRLVELAGGSPAYARKSITWNAASGGNLDSSNAPVFDVQGGDTVDWVGFYSASSGGTLYGIDQVTQEVFGGQGTYTLTDADLDLLAA